MKKFCSNYNAFKLMGNCLKHFQATLQYSKALAASLAKVSLLKITPINLTSVLISK